MVGSGDGDFGSGGGDIVMRAEGSGLAAVRRDSGGELGAWERFGRGAGWPRSESVAGWVDEAAVTGEPWQLGYLAVDDGVVVVWVAPTRLGSDR